MTEVAKARFTTLCPNCEEEITDTRLRIKNPCKICMPNEIREDEYEKLVERIFSVLDTHGRVEKYRTIHDVISRTQDFRAFFRKTAGLDIWSAQRTWAKRFFLGKSFSIVAPTGIGKTSFGMVLSLYLAKEGEKTYILVPTTALLLQIKERLEEFSERAGLGVRVIAIHGKMRKKEKEESTERVKKGEFDILITTTQYLTRNFDLVKEIKFDFVFVDDVDAILRASKNIDRILQLLGYNEEILSITYELIKAKFTIAFRKNDKELREKIEQLEEQVQKYKQTHKTGQIIVSTATGRAYGIRVKLFRELMGFDIGSTRANLRRITNIYADMKDPLVQTIDLVKTMGSGGLIFVPTDMGREFAQQITEALKGAGIRAELATGDNVNRLLPAFQRGDLDVLVGMAAYYGAIVRGIDLPERVRYAVFTGVPKFKFSLRFENAPEGRIAYLLDVVADHIDDEKEASELRRLANRIRRMRKEEDVEKARIILQEYFSNREFLEKIKESTEVAIVEEDGEIKILIADAKTYIQASGRTSRMFAGGVTEGASFVLVDDHRVFRQLARYLRYVLDEDFVSMDEIDLNELKERLDKSRAEIGKKKDYDPVKTVLFVVESPNKARTIANFFGKPSVYRIGSIQGYEVTTGKYILNIVATRGHMFDLVTDRGIHGVELENERFIPVYTTIKLCRRCGVQTVENVCPVCGSSEYLEDAQWRVNALRVFALESDYAIIGTDPDREG
ncbi:MAG: reverse gyrase, partial [Candidatus Diapherotrites archaeon]|nr:reverse gyrase [Candidatus Diapherotrites archaeon]